MDKLAVWIGLKPAVNHTGRLAWFRIKKGGEYEFICHKYDWKPNLNPVHFDLVMTHAINMGAVIRVEKIRVKTSKYMNIKAVLELGGKVITHVASSYQLCIINVLQRFVNNTDLDIRNLNY